MFFFFSGDEMYAEWLDTIMQCNSMENISEWIDTKWYNEIAYYHIYWNHGWLRLMYRDMNMYIYIYIYMRSAWIKDRFRLQKGDQQLRLIIVSSFPTWIPFFWGGNNPWWSWWLVEFPDRSTRGVGNFWALWAQISWFVDVHWVCLSLCRIVLLHSYSRNLFNDLYIYPH